MKRWIVTLITTALLCSAVVIGYSHNRDEVSQRMMEQPRTVLKEARVALNDARSDGSSPHFIEALMQLSAARLLIDSDSITAVVGEVREAMEGTASPVERSVIAIYLCDLYRYAQDLNYHSYANAYIPNNPDMATWNRDNYRDAVDTLTRIALAPAAELQRTPIARYRSVIDVEGYEGDDAWKLAAKFYPTMYDFVLQQVVAYAPAPMPYIDDALLFHTRKGAARFMWLLKKITAGSNIDDADNSHRTVASLDTLIEQYARHDYVIEAVVERAGIALLQAHEVSERKALYDNLQGWIKRYPRYYRIGSLQQMCAELSWVQLNLSLPLVNYPQQPIDVELTYCNTHTVHYRLERCNGVFAPQVDKDGEAKSPRLMRDLSNVEKWSDVTLLCDSTLALTDNQGGLTFDTRHTSFTLPSLPCGIYMLTVSSGDEVTKMPFAVASHLLYGVEVTDNEIWAVVVDNRSGQPVEEETVSLLSTQGDTLQSVRTDANGVARFDNRFYSNYYWLALKDNSRYPFVVRTDFMATGYCTNEPVIQLFTDRSIYRPGQELYFSALLYRMDSVVRGVLSQKEVAVVLRDASYNELWRDTLTTDAYGSVYGSILLPKNALAGDWRLSVEHGNARRNKSITVTEYKRPQFSVECNPIEGTYTYGDTIHVTGRAMGYSAVPVAHATVKYTISRSSWFGYNNETLHAGTTLTNAEGDFALDFVAAEGEESVWRRWGTRYIVDVSVTSPGGEIQSNVAVLSISGTSVRFRIDLPGRVCREGLQPFDVVMLNGEDVMQQLPMQLSLYPLHGDSIGMSTAEMSVGKQPLWSQHYAAGEHCVTLPLSLMQSGAYRLKVATHDHSGACVTDSTDFVLYSQHDTRPPVPVAMWLPVNTMTLGDDETARILVGSSYIDASLLYIIKSGNAVVDAGRIDLNNNIATIDCPYRNTYDDAVRVELILVRNKTIYNERVVVYRHQPDLNLTITPTTFRDKTQPGSPETWKFIVRDAQGNPVKALFMSELYDASLDALRTHQWHFNPQYQPQVPSISIARFWNYPNRQGGYISYYTQYESAKIYPTLSPMLYTYLHGHSGTRFGGLYHAETVMRSTSFKIAGSYDLAVNESMQYAEASVEEAHNDEVGETRMKPDVPVQYRTNLNETAFFYPHLTTDESGNVVISFTMPESNTTWNFLSLAVTPGLQHAMYNAQVVSNKPLMVSPNMPRFVRQGDRAVLTVSVQNTTDDPLTGRAELVLYNPENEKIISTLTRDVSLEAKGVSTVDFEMQVPHNLSLLGVRVGCSTSLYSDGEQHLIAVLPATQLIAESHPFFILPSVTDTTIVFTAMQENLQRHSVDNYRVTLEYCDNPAWYAVTALPSLAQPSQESATSWLSSLYANRVACGIVRQNPTIASVLREWGDAADNEMLTSQLLKNEELKRIVISQTPWLLDAANSTQQMQQIVTLLDEESATQQSKVAVHKLEELQDATGGWSWFKGMSPSYWLTLNILQGLSRLKPWGETAHDEAIAMMEINGLKYIDAQYEKLRKSSGKSVGYLDLCYLYVRSAYADIPMSQEVLSIYREQVACLAREWYRLDEIEKAYAAVVLHRSGHSDAALDIVNSLREYATTTPQQGMYWANNRSSAYYRNSAIQVHCAIYEAFETIDSNSVELDLMRQWLLLQKQTQSWGNQPSTLDAVRILLASGSNWLGSGLHSRVEWGGERLSIATHAEQVMGLGKWSHEGEAVDADDAQVTIRGHQSQPSWGAIYWQYYDSVAHISAQGSNEITLQRRYYVKRAGEWLHVDSATLQVGDEVLVHLQLYTDRDMQFMTLVDPRPACFEPAQQLPQYTSAGDAWYYSVPSDATNTFYFDYLPRGTHLVQYQVYIDREGSYQAAVAELQSYYAPQYTAHSQGDQLRVVR